MAMGMAATRLQGQIQAMYGQHQQQQQFDPYGQLTLQQQQESFSQLHLNQNTPQPTGFNQYPFFQQQQQQLAPPSPITPDTPPSYSNAMDSSLQNHNDSEMQEFVDPMALLHARKNRRAATTAVAGDGGVFVNEHGQRVVYKAGMLAGCEKCMRREAGHFGHFVAV